MDPEFLCIVRAIMLPVFFFENMGNRFPGDSAHVYRFTTMWHRRCHLFLCITLPTLYPILRNITHMGSCPAEKYYSIYAAYAWIASVSKQALHGLWLQGSALLPASVCCSSLPGGPAAQPQSFIKCCVDSRASKRFLPWLESAGTPRLFATQIAWNLRKLREIEFWNKSLLKRVMKKLKFVRNAQNFCVLNDCQVFLYTSCGLRYYPFK